jgi:hypothetical protein
MVQQQVPEVNASECGLPEVELGLQNRKCLWEVWQTQTEGKRCSGVKRLISTPEFEHKAPRRL